MALSSSLMRGLSPFNRWLRTGFWLAEQQTDPTLEVKFNPNHDPTNGQFTFADGGGGGAGMTRPSSLPRHRRGDGTWGGGGFNGGGEALAAAAALPVLG